MAANPGSTSPLAADSAAALSMAAAMSILPTHSPNTLPLGKLPLGTGRLDYLAVEDQSSDFVPTVVPKLGGSDARTVGSFASAR